MSDAALGAASALWLGVLTSISPCPLATNIAAAAFISNNAEKPRLVLLSGMLYTLGRMVVYLAIGALLISGLVAAHSASHVLQTYINQFVGPVLIIAGMVLTGLLRPTIARVPAGERMQTLARSFGIWSSAPVGMVFALSFCPASAALFFGGLVPLALRAGSPTAYPLLFGAGTALPVIVFSILLAYSAHTVGRALNRLADIEVWLRRGTGLLFIGVGVYFTLRYTLGLSW